MLVLAKDKPTAVPLLLGGGAVLWIRPATSIEIYRATAEIADYQRALRDRQAAAEAAIAILGDDLDLSNLDPAMLEALAQRLLLLELVVICAERWDGVCDETGAPLPLDRATLALLLRDSEIARRINIAVNARIHVERAEGNG